ncbi:MAG TPA: cytochrome c biogenesis protein ResB [Bacteroidales bacterium]|nr:cytochrome c biogenesis protein ResB [Bacteroidales bacterium]
MNKDKRKIWQQPWSYKESLVIVLGIIIVGFSLQTTIGSFNFYLLSFPFNIYIGIGIIIFSVLSSIFKRKAFFKWLTSVHLSVSLLIAITLLALIMGLTRQETIPINETTNIFHLLGFNQMTSSWAFVLIYFLILISLLSIISKRKPTLSKKYLVFILNHLGLWLFLFSSGLGYADMNRYIMYVEVGETQWRVFDKEQKVEELPIAIQLNEFTIEEYIPKLAVINKKTGEVQPSPKPQYYQIDTNTKRETNLFGYKITRVEYIHNAVRNSDRTFKEVPMKASTPAALVTVKGKTQKTEWVSSGSSVQFPQSIDLDSSFALVMTPPETKSYISNVDVYTKDEEHVQGDIRVNHPMTIGSWKIYQYGYDNNMGKLSTYSSFELVYDPWLKLVYIGIGMIFLGSIFLIIFGINYKK